MIHNHNLFPTNTELKATIKFTKFQYVISMYVKENKEQVELLKIRIEKKRNETKQNIIWRQ